MPPEDQQADIYEAPYHPYPQQQNHAALDDLPDRKEHLAIVFGKIPSDLPPMVRIHSECLTGDVFGSSRCDCGKQLEEAMKTFSETSGIILYLRQEGRGIGLYAKIDAYALQTGGMDTYEANHALGFEHDSRSYESAASMLRSLGVTAITLLSNNTDKQRQLEQYGINVIRRINTATYMSPYNSKYLSAKIKFGHDIQLKAAHFED
jgi:GTP cyclohydrolase II